jgi:hypothetical protein
MSSLVNSKEEVIRYHLRSHSIPSDPTSFVRLQGLGKNPNKDPKNGKGRKSHLFKAQSKALIDLAASRKLSIDGALRVGNGPCGSEQ